MKNVVLVPDLRNTLGGPASFQKRLAEGLNRRGIGLYYDGGGRNCDALLLINATRSLGNLLRARIRGARIVQRLGSPFPSGRHLPVGRINRMRTWLSMQNVAFTRRLVADRIVYQSHFVKSCWDRIYGSLGKPAEVIYNGVDLARFTPGGPAYDSHADICIISVEGSQIFPEQSPAFLVAQALKNRDFDVELLVFGKPWSDTASRYGAYSFVSFMGPVPNEELPYYYRGATLYVLNDIVNAGCPNSVLEALACGTPVVGYSPGVLPEMLTPEAGICVPAVGDPWKGEEPGNVNALADAAMEIVVNNSTYRRGARQLAEDRYDLSHMVDQYVKVLLH